MQKTNGIRNQTDEVMKDENDNEQQSTLLESAAESVAFYRRFLKEERQHHEELKRELKGEMERKLAEHSEYIQAIEMGDLRPAEEQYEKCKRMVTCSQ